MVRLCESNIVSLFMIPLAGAQSNAKQIALPVAVHSNNNWVRVQGQLVPNNDYSLVIGRKDHLMLVGPY